MGGSGSIRLKKRTRCKCGREWLGWISDDVYLMAVGTHDGVEHQVRLCKRRKPGGQAKDSRGAPAWAI